MDNPPEANGGPDRVVQPQESLTLNGNESKDDHDIVTYLWHLVSGNTSAVIEVGDDDWGIREHWSGFIGMFGVFT